MTDPAVLIPLVVLAFVLLLVGMVLNYRKWKLQHNQAALHSGDESLTTSELTALMQEAVANATLPLAERIELLEGRVEQLAQRPLPPARGERLAPLQHAPLDVPVPGRPDAV